MAIVGDENREVHMSIRMERALDDFRRMTPAEQVGVMVKAGLIEEADAPQAIANMIKNLAARPKKRARRKPSAKQEAGPEKP